MVRIMTDHHSLQGNFYRHIKDKPVPKKRIAKLIKTVRSFMEAWLNHRPILPLLQTTLGSPTPPTPSRNPSPPTARMLAFRHHRIQKQRTTRKLTLQSTFSLRSLTKRNVQRPAHQPRQLARYLRFLRHSSNMAMKIQPSSPTLTTPLLFSRGFPPFLPKMKNSSKVFHNRSTLKT